MKHGRKGLRRLSAAIVLAAVISAMGIVVAGSSAKTVKAGSKGTLTIGVITSVGGAVIDYPFTVAAVDAAVHAINQAGGINGYKFGVFYCNTQGDPNQEVACARQAVDHHVVATVGSFIFTNPQGFYQTLQDASIADVGQIRASTQSFTFKNSFPLVFSDASFAACLSPAVLKAVGSNTSAVVAADTPATAPIINLITSVAAANNLPAPKIIRVPVTASDLTPYAQQAAGSGVVIGAFPGASTVAFINAAQAIGVHFAYCTTQGIVSLQPWVDLGKNVGDVFVGINHDTPTTAPNNLLMKQFVKEITAENKRGDTRAILPTDKNFNSQEVHAWLGVQAIKQVIKSMKGPVNNQTFLAAIATAKLTMRGVTPPIDFHRCIAAGPYTRVFNWVARAAKWNATTQTFDVLPHSQFDALRLAFGKSAERSGDC